MKKEEMRKELVIIGVVGLCLAFSVAENKKKPISGDSDEPGFEKFTRIDVNNSKVQAAAKIILAGITKQPACSGFTLVDVKKATHNLGGAGILYELNLRFRTADNQIKKCKTKVWGSVLDVAQRQTSKPKPAPVQKRLPMFRPGRHQYQSHK